MKTMFQSVVVSIVATLLLGLIYFVENKVINPLPSLEGEWKFETVVEKTDYKPYKGMALTFNVLLHQDGADLSGSGEKVKERLGADEKEYVGNDRVRIDIKGRIDKKLFWKDVVFIQFEEHGERRTSTTNQTLRYEEGKMDGSYVSTIANQSGRVTWERGWR